MTVSAAPVSPTLTAAARSVPLPMLVGAGVALYFAALCVTYLLGYYGHFGEDMFIWLVVVGGAHLFGGATLGNVSPLLPRVRSWAMVMAFAGLLPMMGMYSPQQTAVLWLIAMQSARMIGVRTRRDVHFSLVVAFLALYFASGHVETDWTMSFYAVPCALAILFVLAYENAHDFQSAGDAPSIFGPLVGSIGSALVIGVLAALIYFAMPRPPGLGFGFFPDNHEYAGESQRPGAAKARSDDGKPAKTGGALPNAGRGDAAHGGGSGWVDRARRMLREMSLAQRGAGLADWQRGMIRGAVGTGEAIVGVVSSLSVTLYLRDLLWLLLAAASTWWAARRARRQRIATRMRAWVDRHVLSIHWRRRAMAEASPRYYRAAARLLSLYGLQRLPVEAVSVHAQRVVLQQPALGQCHASIAQALGHILYGPHPEGTVADIDRAYRALYERATLLSEVLPYGLAGA